MVRKSLRKDEKNKRVVSELDQRAFFFKIFHPQLTEERLKIPSQFVRDNLMDQVLPKRIILEGPSGGPWSVKVVKTAEGEVFLEDGWQKFVEDNRLQLYNFLFFGYDHEAGRLTVQIFEGSGLERDHASAITTHDQEDANLSGSQNSDPPTTGHVHNSRRGLNRKNSAIIQEKVGSFYSRLPFFETLIKRYNVGPPHLMFIPKWFAEQHFQRGKSNIRLKNSEGKEWEVNYTITRERFVFVGGWSRFVRDNKLKTGDVCIFELVAEKVLQVHIF